MNNKAIETLAVNAVKDSISLCDFLEPYIAENDKEPSWDGKVYVYTNKDHKKGNIKGRPSVQVKGKECNATSNDEISFSMSTVDLNNYLHDGGVILFVVYVDRYGGKTIYYIELPPIKLRVILSSALGKKTTTLKLKKFPIDNNKKAQIFYNFIKNSEMQSSFQGANLYTLEELTAKGLLEKLSVPITLIGEKDVQRALVSSEVYIYAHIKDFPIPQPLEFIPISLSTNEERNINVSVGDIVFYTKIQVIKTATDTKFKIGQSFTVTFIESTNTAVINFKNPTKARVIAHDLKFLIASIKEGYFKINEFKIPIDRDSKDLSKIKMTEEIERLRYAEEVCEVLELLNCNEDIDFATLTPSDFRNLGYLITAFIKKNPIEHLAADLLPVSTITVGNLSFALCLKVCDCSTTYQAFDFFESEIPMVFETATGENLPISQYAILQIDDLLSISNMRFDKLLPSFQKLMRHPDIFSRTNLFLLDLLTAFDRSEGKRAEILKTAQDFATWLLNESTEEELPHDIKLLNYLQAIKRERDFNDTELAELFMLVENSGREDILVGAYLLLGQQKVAQTHFENLPIEQQDSFKLYPIYHFWTL